MKKISKRILAGALAGTMLASFAGCSGNSKDEIPSNLSSYEQSFVDEYGYNNYTYDELSEYMVVKYKTIDSNKERISVLYPFYDAVSDDIYVYDLDGKLLFNNPLGVKDTAKRLDISPSSIARVTNGTYQQCKGYRFSYKLETLPPLNIKSAKQNTKYQNYRQCRILE